MQLPEATWKMRGMNIEIWVMLTWQLGSSSTSPESQRERYRFPGEQTCAFPVWIDLEVMPKYLFLGGYLARWLQLKLQLSFLSPKKILVIYMVINFFPRKCPLISSHWLSNRGLFPFLLISTVSLTLSFFFPRHLGTLHYIAQVYVKPSQRYFTSCRMRHQRTSCNPTWSNMKKKSKLDWFDPKHNLANMRLFTSCALSKASSRKVLA